MTRDDALILLTVLRSRDAPCCSGFEFDAIRERINGNALQGLLKRAGIDVTPGCGHPTCRWAKFCTVDYREKARELANVGRLHLREGDVLDREFGKVKP